MAKYYAYAGAPPIDMPQLGESIGQGVNNSMASILEDKRKNRDIELQLRMGGAIPEEEVAKSGLDVTAPEIKPYVQTIRVFNKNWYMLPKGADILKAKYDAKKMTDYESPAQEREAKYKDEINMLREKSKMAPKGFRWTSTGDLEPISGGAFDIKEQKVKEKEEALKKGQIVRADLVLEKVDQAISKVSPWTAGMGSLLAKIPATPARDLQSDLDTIKANLGFQQLQEMRANSPTGGALGQISDRENTLLQSTISSLDTAQDSNQLKARLEEVRKHYNNVKLLMQGINPDEQGSNNNNKKNGGVLSIDANGNKAIVYPDGSFEEVQ